MMTLIQILQNISGLVSRWRFFFLLYERLSFNDNNELLCRYMYYVSFLIGSSYAIHTNISLIMSMDTYRMLCISRSFALRRTFLFFIFFQHFRQRGSRRRGQGLHAGRHAPRENGYRGGTGRVSALQISGQINAFSWNIDKQVLDRGMEV